MKKQEYRKQMQNKISELSVQKKENYHNQISSFLFSSDDWQNANHIGITVSIKNEIDTKKVIECGWREGKKVSVPKCFSETREMIFREISSWEQT
ncbi:5-formyltetrahydrofolate cyclo-ligase [Bacillus carboniphilus]|uniref:5-formyltetrahydrofolate cyclo-ligase n=1 Tax=Bacillus carboniphilus TaxID=86663 RepID=A0ABY9JYU1_9BACI|nr:5-formyltetrahydrofolate cyclo-ligase [Bacillus carboniphilus]WLR43943.1 5-formyltetrahydrofolate cyclo-ligase [Bacillus carboniphilus]